MKTLYSITICLINLVVGICLMLVSSTLLTSPGDLFYFIGVIVTLIISYMAGSFSVNLIYKLISLKNKHSQKESDDM
jgi:hypothetical protein